MAIVDPANAPNNPVSIIGVEVFRSMFFSLKCVIKATIAIGINTAKLTPWAWCWFRFEKIINPGIRIVPPPMPIPLIIPDNKPIKNSFIS